MAQDFGRIYFMMKCKWLVRLVLIALTLTGTVYPAFSQLVRGAISGVVSDPSGAVLPGVQVIITNKETNISRDTTTNERGFYRFAALEPADYTVQFQLSGFEARKVDTVSITTAQEATINQTLMVGGVTAEIS